ncbi:YfcC family protein [Aminipila butyrica]|uniref:YfcC family protein n=1 Tax=Aminipila butyrica TaxID=433296 RepID=A0A858BUL0_9FIRM|nr:AbgT family transporter [Aminipila butyrica]QIB68464.1 YfcC family protein [Aminipila butyrica]
MGNQQSAENLDSKKEKKKGINTFVLLFGVLIAMAILSYILPAGQYERHEVDGRNVVIEGTYHIIDRTPVDAFHLFTAIHEGLVEAAPIVFYVIIIGGMINVMNATGALNGLLSTTAEKLAKQRLAFIAILMLLFALGGAFIGMAEESLMYIPIIIPFALALGFDAFTGCAIVLMGMSIGFTSAVMNPFTIGLAQGIAELPLFSGLHLRLALFVVFYMACVGFVYHHANQVAKDPSKGIWGDRRYEGVAIIDKPHFTTRHKLILLAFVGAIACLVVGVLKYGFYMGEYSGVFIIVSIIFAIIGKMSSHEYIDKFMEGAQGILSGALICGFARGIVVVLTNGNIIDTILNGAATILEQTSSAVCAAGMFVVQALIHLLVPSGSGQAMLTMPIMVPLADLLGVTRQTACLIFTLADGIGNTILPTSGYFMAALAVAGLSWGQWAKKIWPFVLAEYVISIVVVVLANMAGYGPF